MLLSSFVGLYLVVDLETWEVQNAVDEMMWPKSPYFLA